MRDGDGTRDDADVASSRRRDREHRITRDQGGLIGAPSGITVVSPAASPADAEPPAAPRDPTAAVAPRPTAASPADSGPVVAAVPSPGIDLDDVADLF